MSMAKPCAPPKRRHTKSTGCLVHKSKNPGRSPASNNLTLTDRSNFRQIGPTLRKSCGKAEVANSVARVSAFPNNSNKLQCKPPSGSYFTSTVALLYFNGCTGVGELLPDGLGFFLVDALFDRLGRAVHQILGFLEPQIGDFTNRFDDVDLVRASRGQDHVKLGLLFSRRCSRRPSAACRSRRHGSRRSRDAQLFLEQFHQLRRFQQRQPLNLFRNRVDVRHDLLFLLPYSNLLIVRTCFPSPPDPPPPQGSGQRPKA